MYGWCACIRGVESGGLVEGLPVHNFQTDSGRRRDEVPHRGADHRPPREGARRTSASCRSCTARARDYAAFFSVQSAQKAKVYDKDAATANARISAQLPYIFAVSRFAHYLKAMMRDKIGGYMSRSEAQMFLNNWIANYVVANDDAALSVKAKSPLKEARVDVEEVPGKPGVYRAVAFLRPHFQLDELSISMRLVAELPAPAK